MKYYDASVWSYKAVNGVEEWDEASDSDFDVVDGGLKTNKNFEVRVTYKKSGVFKYKTFHVPEGWWFDGASVPRMFWNIIGKPTDRKFRIPALVHDYLYGERWHRELADAAFRDLLEQENVWCAKATIMWAAVRIGGHAYYAADKSSFWKSVRELL